MKRIPMTKGADIIEVHASKVEEMKTKGWEVSPPGPILTAGYSPEVIEIEASEGVTDGDTDSSND